MGEQTKIGPAGEIKLPANLLAHLGLDEGDALDVNVYTLDKKAGRELGFTMLS